MKNKLHIVLSVLLAVSLFGNAYLFSDNQKLSDVAIQITALEQEKTALSEQLATITTTNETLTADLKTAMTSIETLNAENATLLLEIESIKAELKKLNTTTVKSTPSVKKQTPSKNTSTSSKTDYTPEDHDGPEVGPEGEKPGFIYVPGYGYIEDGGGGTFCEGTSITEEEAAKYENIGNMG